MDGVGSKPCIKDYYLNLKSLSSNTRRCLVDKPFTSWNWMARKEINGLNQYSPY